MSNETTQLRWLDDVERKILDVLFHNPPSPRVHDRATALRLASQGYKTTQIVGHVNPDFSFEASGEITIREDIFYAPVPLPATLPLLASAFAWLAIARWRGRGEDCR